MGVYEIGNRAALQLAQETGWPVQFQRTVATEKPLRQELFDGQLQIRTTQGSLNFPVEIKRNLRRARLPYLRDRLGTDGDWLLIADYLSQPLQQELRANQINYLDAAGNAFLQHQGIFILVEGRKPIMAKQEAERDAFKPAELMLLFSFLIEPNLLQESYRVLEPRLGTSKATLSSLIGKLKRKGYLTGQAHAYSLQETRKLLNEVSPMYHHKVKPRLMVKRFQFVRPQLYAEWPQWSLPAGTRWGGEAAVHLLHQFLLPEAWSLYTTASVQELIRHVPIVPKSDGPITLYQQFWPAEIERCSPSRVVPTPLIYADLLGSGIGRNRQAAQALSLAPC